MNTMDDKGKSVIDFKLGIDESRREELYKFICDYVARVQLIQKEDREVRDLLKNEEEIKMNEETVETRRVFLQELNELLKALAPKTLLSDDHAILLQYILDNDYDKIPRELLKVPSVSKDRAIVKADTGASSKMSAVATSEKLRGEKVKAETAPSLTSELPTVPSEPPPAENAEPGQQSKSILQHVTDFFCLCCRLRHERYK